VLFFCYQSYLLSERLFAKASKRIFGAVFSFMRLKDGVQKCPKCLGAGCFSCARTGEVTSCPACGNVDLFERSGDEIRCSICRTVFDKGGQVHGILEEPEVDPYTQREEGM
jgi:hypothetical protein